MIRLLFLLFFTLGFSNLKAQELTDTTYTPNTITETSHVKESKSAEQQAWEQMLPYHFKQAEKSAEMRSYEEMLIRLKKGVADLSAIKNQMVSGSGLD